MVYFLQALPYEIRLHLIGDDISLDDIAQKADAIYAELKYNSQSSCASDTKSPNLQVFESVPDQESNLYPCDVGQSAVNYENIRKPNDGTLIQTILITGDDLTITIHVIVIVVLLIPTTCPSCAGTAINMVLSKLGNAMENLVLCSLV